MRQEMKIFIISYYLIINSLRIVPRKKLQTSFLEEWDVKTSSTSKLSFYRKCKQNHKLENYIVLVNNRRQRSALAKLRCSAHRLKLEIGRYSRFYGEETKRHEQLPREKRNFFQKLYKIVTEDIQLWSDTDKIKYLFSTTDKSVINCFGKFVFDSFEKHRKRSTHRQKEN